MGERDDGGGRLSESVPFFVFLPVLAALLLLGFGLAVCLLR